MRAARSDSPVAPDSAGTTAARDTEVLISTLLRAGVLTSLALVVVGTAVSFAHHADYLSSATAFDGLRSLDASFPRSIGTVLAGLGHFQGSSIVMLGLLLLIATPVLRVAISIVAFAREGDRTFVALTSVVLALLLLSLFLGKAGG